MTDEQNQAIKAALLPLLEPDAKGDVQISTAISLKRIADKLAETPRGASPQVLHR
jgi:hypothetical protein